MPIPFAIFLLMYMIWGHQVSLLSIMTPKNLVSFTSVIWLPFMRIPSILREKCLGVNNMKFVLSMLRDNLLAFTQQYTLPISTFIWLTTSFKFFPVQKRIVSSTKSIGIKRLETEGKSFIWIKNSKGPSIKPWGTPHFIALKSDSCLLYTTACDL